MRLKNLVALLSVVCLAVLVSTVAYADAMKRVWTNVTDPTSVSDALYGVDADSNENVYLAGACTGCGPTGGQAIYLLSFDAQGNSRWMNISDPNASNDLALDIVVDGDDDIIIGGYCTGCGTGLGEASFISKYDSDGVHLWTNVSDVSPGSTNDEGRGVAVDSLGNIFFTGSCSSCGSLGLWGLYLIKFSPSGEFLWMNITDPSVSSDFGQKVAVDSLGNAYMAGYCYACGGLGGYAFYTAKFNPDGNHLWTDITDLTADAERVYDIAVDDDDNVILTGDCDTCGTVGGSAMVIIKMNSSGSHLWQNITDPMNQSDVLRSVDTDTDGNVFVGGSCTNCGSVGGSAMHLIKFDPAGNHLWTNITDVGTSTDSIMAVKAYSNESVYVAGYCVGCGALGGAAAYVSKFAYPAMPSYSSFVPYGATTNFSSASDIMGVPNLSLANNHGRIRFPASHPVNADGQNYDVNVKIGSNFVSVNTSGLDASFNSSANITLEGIDCEGYAIYYGPGAYDSAEDIIALEQVCPGSVCHDMSCVGGSLTFTAEHFTGYASGDNANLTIYDELELGGVKHESEAVVFYANYTNVTGGAHIGSAQCNISFADGTGPFAMVDTASQYTYNKTAGFSSGGTYGWNVTCAKSGYNTLFASDDVSISSSTAIPEFSGLGLAVAAIAILLGLVILRPR